MTKTMFSLFLLTVAFPVTSFAQEDEAQGETTGLERQITSDVPSEQLRFLVKPLTVDEVELEIQKWLKLVRAKGIEIANKKASVRQISELVDQQETAGRQTEEIAKVATEVKQASLDEIAQLRSEEVALLDRLDVVIESFEAKGGDVESVRKYVAVQRGVQVDTSDFQTLWAAVKGWFFSDEGGKFWAWRFFAFCLILTVTRIVTGIMSSIVRRVLARTSQLSRLAESLISRSVRNVLSMLGLLIALTTLGVDIGPLLAAVGATGFIVGFALQGTLSNFASGLMILLNRPFDVGDVVTAGGVTGTVSEMNLVSTTFSTFDNQKIIVPNNEIWDNVITNVTARDTRRVDLKFSVGYDDDFDQVEVILKDVVQQHSLILQDPEPTIKLHELADSSVIFICRPWAKTEDYWSVYWDLTKLIKQRFDEAGISIPYPQRGIHMKTDVRTNSATT